MRVGALLSWYLVSESREIWRPTLMIFCLQFSWGMKRKYHESWSPTLKKFNFLDYRTILMIVGWHTQELLKLVSSPWIWFYCLCGFYCLPSVKVKVCWNMLIIFSSLKTTVPECFTGDRSWQRIQIRGSIWWREEKNSWQWKLYNQSPQLSNIERVGQTRRNRPDCRSQDKCLHPWPSIPIYHRIWSDLEVSTHSGLYHLGI